MKPGLVAGDAIVSSRPSDAASRAMDTCSSLCKPDPEVDGKYHSGIKAF